MSIEAIKEALAAVEVPCPEGFEDGTPHDVRAFIAMGSRRNALRALEAACTPAAIRSLIERLEAAEKDAARYAWLRDSHPADGGVWAAMGIPNTPAGISCWRHEELDAAIDSAMDGALAEGVE